MDASRTDSQAEAAIREELAWDSRIDDAAIDVSVDAGVAVLAGTVGSYAEKMAAIEAAQVFAGAHELVCDLDIVSAEDREPTDDELATMINSLLTWDALVPSQHLTIVVEDGFVTISGSVSTDAQRQEAELAVRRVLGVQGIADEIVVAAPTRTLGSAREAIRAALASRAAHQANHIDVTVDGAAVTLRGTVQSMAERRAIVGAVSHADGVELVNDQMLLEPVEQSR